ncbi:MAG TPA: outer membrane beta-barrel protein [Xanthobacteraceae bacterium]
MRPASRPARSGCARRSNCPAATTPIRRAARPAAAPPFSGDRDHYVGSARQDDRSAASAALTYKLSREWQLKGELRREWLSSNLPGNNYQAYAAMLGVRLQR